MAIAQPVSPSNSRLKVKVGDRWLLMGTSGSGKTTALKYLDAVYGRLFPTARHFVLDSKMDGDFDDWPGRIISDTCPSLPDPNQKYQVWQVVNILPDEIEKWFVQILHDAKSGPALVEIDELHTLVYKPNVYSPKFNQILKTGRGLGIGTIALTQELSKIPANAYKQATHRLGFYIDRAAIYDRQIWQALLKSKVADPPDEYGLYYQQEKWRGEPQYFPNIQSFLGL